MCSHILLLLFKCWGFWKKVVKLCITFTFSQPQKSINLSIYLSIYTYIYFQVKMNFIMGWAKLWASEITVAIASCKWLRNLKTESKWMDSKFDVPTSGPEEQQWYYDNMILFKMLWWLKGKYLLVWKLSHYFRIWLVKYSFPVLLMHCSLNIKSLQKEYSHFIVGLH